MKIIADGKEHEVSGQQPLIEELRHIGYDIPSLCYNKNAEHQASCMVCMVRNTANGQMIPSCSTMPTEGMSIEVDSDEVRNMRKIALELLLSDHRADCEAPCSVVCPAGIDVAQLILHYDRGETDKAREQLLKVAGSNGTPCTDCKAPCEKACRRGTVDKRVSIREIVTSVSESITKEVRTHYEATAERKKHFFSSKLGRYTDAEKEWLKEIYSQPSGCLHCACEGRDKCKLREAASAAQIKSSRYGVSSRQIVKEQIHVSGNLYYEPAKCIRCGLCVYNTSDGFTFRHRGFDMQVVIPDQSKRNVNEEVARLCPTGALFVRE